MRTLHIIKNATDRLPFQVMGAGNPQQAGVLLLQDGVLAEAEGEAVYACLADVEARGVRPAGRLVDYQEIVDLIFSHDKVICW